MKKNFQKLNLISFNDLRIGTLKSNLSLLLFLGSAFFTFSISAQTLCNNSIGSQGGYTYEYWKDNGSGCMTLNNGGDFYIEWSNIGNLLARKGKRPGVKNQTVTYGANYQPSGNSYLCIYGWTTSPLVEYYIVDSWGSWRPPGANSKGTVTTDGGTYDIYETTRVNQPSIQGTKTFKQYWSVRRSKRTSGTVTCANHFNAWVGKGMNMGNLYEVSLTVEGYQSSGTCNVYSMTMGTSNGNNNGGGSGGNTIIVRAKGVAGGEKINVRIGTNTIAVHTLTNYYKEYTTSTNSNGGVNVEYFNDSNGKDVQVDYVKVNGNTRQAEQQSYNTAVWQNNSCGGSYSEWMHCNGIIGFGNANNARLAINNDQSNTVDQATTVVFPNPVTNGVLNLNLGDLKNVQGYTLKNMLGQTIQTFPAGIEAQHSLRLNAKPGNYIFQIESASQMIRHQIIIK